MSSERERKRISEHVGAWDKFKTLITPGDINEKQRKLLDIADANERDAQLEAIKRKRMNAGK